MAFWQGHGELEFSPAPDYRSLLELRLKQIRKIKSDHLSPSSKVTIQGLSLQVVHVLTKRVFALPRYE
jgi:hypothetical protein